MPSHNILRAMVQSRSFVENKSVGCCSTWIRNLHADFDSNSSKGKVLSAFLLDKYRRMVFPTWNLSEKKTYMVHVFSFHSLSTYSLASFYSLF